MRAVAQPGQVGDREGGADRSSLRTASTPRTLRATATTGSRVSRSASSRMGSSLPIRTSASQRSSSSVRTARCSSLVRGHAAEHDVVATRLGRPVDAVDEAGVELLTCGETTPSSLVRCDRSMRARGRAGSRSRRRPAGPARGWPRWLRARRASRWTPAHGKRRRARPRPARVGLSRMPASLERSSNSLDETPL